jgi:serine/threonine-protein kinase ULK4
MNNFSLSEEIGRGKYSVVYKGRKKQTLEYYTIKSIEKQNKPKVLNEVNVLKHRFSSSRGWNFENFKPSKYHEVL